MERSTGRRPRELDGPGLPAGMGYLWEWFLELHAGRASSGFGPTPLTYSEMNAWAHLTGTAPTPWEVAVLKALDADWMHHYAGERK